MSAPRELAVRLQADGVALGGDRVLPEGARGVVLFAHGSGSSRHSPRNRAVAQALNRAGLGTLLMDLLTREEEAAEARTGHLPVPGSRALRGRFDIDLLSRRLAAATDWLRQDPETAALPLGYFGASTGAAAALVAAASRPDAVSAVVSRGGRPDLAGEALTRVLAPTLLIVGGNDFGVIELNQQAYERLRCDKRMEIVPGASHLFEEPGTLDEVARLATEWFLARLPAAVRP